MSTIELTERELAIREQLIKADSEGKTLYYSDLVNEEDASLVRSLGAVLERIIRYDIKNKKPILASIVLLKSTGLPSEGFFELRDTLDIDAHLSNLQKSVLSIGGRMKISWLCSDSLIKYEFPFRHNKLNQRSRF